MKSIAKKIGLYLIGVITLIILIYIGFILINGGFTKNFSLNILDNYNNETLFFAHRGIGNYYPENSIESFRMADSLGFEAIELDISITMDKQIIVFHDEDTERLLGIKSKIGKLNSKELAKQNYIFQNKVSSSKVIKLEELFREFGNRFIYYLDFKIEDYEIIKKVVDLVKKYNINHKTIFASADFLLISRIENNFPEINTALEGFNSGKEFFYYLIPADFKPDYYSSFLKNTDESHISWLRKQNLLNRRIVYGVDSSNYQTAEKLGIKNLIIDFDSNYINYFKNLK